LRKDKQRKSAMILILLGPPGVGKGTQAKLLSERFHIPHVSTGDILRATVVAGTSLGKKASEYLSRGDLVPDDVMVGIVGEELAQPKYKNGFVLDGFPRTIKQAEALEMIFHGINRKIDGVLYFEADDAELMRRLSRRRMCRQCHSIFSLDLDEVQNPSVCPRCGGELYQRDDDREETVRRRLEVFKQSTAPLKDFYSERRLLRRINAIGDVQVVFGEILSAISAHHGKAQD
jgi:adenylate kinase